MQRKLVAIALVLGLLAASCGDDDESLDGYCRTESEAEEMGSSANPMGDDEQASTECYIGLSKDEAAELADSSDRPWRIVSEDGEDFPVTRDFAPARLNFAVIDDEITEVTLG